MVWVWRPRWGTEKGTSLISPPYLAAISDVPFFLPAGPPRTGPARPNFRRGHLFNSKAPQNLPPRMNILTLRRFTR